MKTYFSKRPYRKGHPLFKIYQLQREIVDNGGTIKRDSDLLAYFERRSYNPELDPFEILDNLAWANSIWVSEKYERTKKIIDYEMLAFTSGEGVDLYEKMIRTQRLKKGDGLMVGFSYRIPPIEDKRFERGGYFLSDSEYVMKRNGMARVIILNPIYNEIFPMIINRNENWPNYTNKMNHYVIAAIILSLSLIISSFILAQSSRYEMNSFIRIDKWTGKSKIIEVK